MTQATPEVFPPKIEAKCCACGASWQHYRGQGYSCPLCAAIFDAVFFTSGKGLALFVGERYDEQQARIECGLPKPEYPAEDAAGSKLERWDL